MPEKKEQTTEVLGGGQWLKVKEDCDWVDVSSYLKEVEAREPIVCLSMLSTAIYTDYTITVPYYQGEGGRRAIETRSQGSGPDKVSWMILENGLCSDDCLRNME